MKALNFKVQQVAFALVLAICLVGIWEPGYFVFLLYLQFVVGIYQYLWSTVVLFDRDLRKVYGIHWILSTLVLAVLILGETYRLEGQFPILGISFFFVLPWALAIYFTWITYTQYKSQSK